MDTRINMAESLSHKFGQIIGDVLELAILPNLEVFAKKNNLYLDKKGKRTTRKGVKLSWTDLNDNKHDLDYVLERGGTETTLGSPAAFIEIAWRRYTKHSRNKAQEIQGAIIPLAEKYKKSSPFKGVILAGMFTSGALQQLLSQGFTVLYFPYETVIKAFSAFGIDADFNEKTPENDFQDKIASWKALENPKDVAIELLRLNEPQVTHFFKELTNSVSRFIDKVLVLPMYGKQYSHNSVNEALDFIKSFTPSLSEMDFIKYEIIISYNTGDRIEASLKDKEDALKFLAEYL